MINDITAPICRVENVNRRFINALDYYCNNFSIMIKQQNEEVPYGERLVFWQLSAAYSRNNMFSLLNT